MFASAGLNIRKVAAPQVAADRDGSQTALPTEFVNRNVIVINHNTTVARGRRLLADGSEGTQTVPYPFIVPENRTAIISRRQLSAVSC